MLASQLAGRLSPIVITPGLALYGSARGFLGGLAALKTLGEVGHVDAGWEQPDAFFREMPTEIDPDVLFERFRVFIVTALTLFGYLFPYLGH
jgi:hypothetical protein